MLKRQITALNDAEPYSEDYYWRQASIYNTLKITLGVWAANAKKCRNKTERKEYALMILELVEKYNKILETEE